MHWNEDWLQFGQYVKESQKFEKGSNIIKPNFFGGGSYITVLIKFWHKPTKSAKNSCYKWYDHSQKTQNFPDSRLCCTKTFWTTKSETFQSVRKLSRVSGNFPEYPQTFQNVRKLSGVYWNFPESPETFPSVWKSETENAKAFQIADFDEQKLSGQRIWKLFRVFGNFSEW